MKRRINSALLYAALAMAGADSKPAECHGNDSAEQLHRLLRLRGGGRHGRRAEDQHDPLFYIALGLSQGVMPLAGCGCSGGNLRRMKETVSFSRMPALSFAPAASAGRFPRRLSGPPVSVGGFFGGRRFPGLGSAGPCPAPQIALGIPALFLLDRLRPMRGLACAQLPAGPALSCAAVYTLAKLFCKTE